MERKKRKLGEALGTLQHRTFGLCSHPHPGNSTTRNSFKTDPFFGLSDEDTPAACSLFDEKFFESCPPHLNRVGGLRTLITELLCEDGKRSKATAPELDSIVGYFYLHFSSVDEEEDTSMRTRISSAAAEKIMQCVSQKAFCIDSTNTMIEHFLCEMMTRVRTAIQNHLMNPTDGVLILDVSCSYITARNANTLNNS